MAIRPKTEVTLSLTGHGQSHARSQVRTRDVATVIDEPLERGGTNLGLSPTETLMASLIGCTNVIAKRIAHGMGVRMDDMKVTLQATFDRRGTMLAEEVAVPFPRIVMEIAVATDATPEQIAAIRTDLARFCPVSKVLRAAGTEIDENWTVTPLTSAAY